ncbi:hypothetical protein CHH28_17375 [Bacterioplanes sanyensis]|uniref:Bacterial toxin 46 domain-containing protein n=1 Tax=Bacterioplanes sanyensis TaxID=1249553 RepID=A0A222FMT5_9GAMM|nr:polymorphic toxin type 46 domain-containing protein [Bacterioplanes sanyensis]ASP40338.1 hypothetical protein CHH28_17375 [Bacterioplanes sanyensis]
MAASSAVKGSSQTLGTLSDVTPVACNEDFKVGQLDGYFGGVVPNSSVDATAARRVCLNEKYGRTGDLNSDNNVRGRQDAAFNFYKSQGFDEVDISSQLSGIDFTQPVDIVTINSGK